MRQQEITPEQINKTQKLLHHFNIKAIRILSHASTLQWHFTNEELDVSGANQSFTYIKKDTQKLLKDFDILSDFLRDNFDIKGDYDKEEDK